MGKTKAKQKTKSKKSYISKMVFCFMLVFVMAIGARVINRGKMLKELNAQEVALTQQIEVAKQENLRLSGDDTYYSSDAYIEKIAREQLGLVMPDELVFKDRQE